MNSDTFTLAGAFAPLLSGDAELPNYKEMDLSTGVANIAAGGGLSTVPGVKSARIPGSDRRHWARYFLGMTQGGGLDGTGYVMFWENSKGRIGRFALCEHKKIEGAGADHRRGWHPGHCEKCGLDMSYDSGD